jgi:hypothetical protein
MPFRHAAFGPLFITIATTTWGAPLDHTFTQQAQPLLEHYCVKCHNPDKKKGEVDLTLYKDTTAVQQDFKVWQKVLQQIEDEEMPPKDPQPTVAEREKLVSYVRRALDGIDWSAHRSVGRVTLARLTKEEYNHTMRDLLGVDLRPGDGLLDDGQGNSGFNNDRDALFVSPALAEQYFDAADRALGGLLALHGERFSKTYESESMFMTEKGSKPDDLPGGGQGYALNRGQMTLYDALTVPHDGWYRITVRIVGVGGDSGARLRIDDEPCGDLVAAHNEPKEQVLNVLLRAGTHQMAWNVQLPAALAEASERAALARRGTKKAASKSKAKPPAYAPLPKNANEIITKASMENVPVWPDASGSTASSINRLLISLQRPVEWMRLVTPEGDPAELRKYLHLLDDRQKVYAEAMPAIAKTLGLTTQELEVKLRQSNAAKLADRDKVIADSRAIAGPVAVKVGNAGIDWIKVEGAIVPKGQPGDLVFSEKGQDAPKVIAQFLRRAFRRPLLEDETARYVKFYDQGIARGDSHELSLRHALAAALVSPSFLFRDELGTSEGGALNDHQIASRLSYFLWMTMPDDTLMRLADNGTLHEPDILRAQVKRMCADPRARDFESAFLGQWLGFSILGRTHIPDEKKFRSFTPALADAMRQEPVLLFDKLIRSGGSVLQFLDSRETFVNETLATHYGINGVKGETMQPVALTDNSRGGLLGMGAILTTTATPNRTSPVIRGKWVLETLLGRHLAEPPADAGQLDDKAGEDRGKTLREELAEHRRNETCATCHDKLDPIGFGLENFDAIGRFRLNEAGKPVDARGELPSGATFNGSAELRAWLVKNRSKEFARNFTQHLLAFALGRELKPEDEGNVRDLLKKLQEADYRADSLLEAIVMSEPFLHQGPSAK